jgi:FlaA1/EpsC-like NDP-sugar epimerase
MKNSSFKYSLIYGSLIKKRSFVEIFLQKLYATLSCLTNRRLSQIDVCIFLTAPIIAIFLRIDSFIDITIWAHWGLVLAILSFVAVKWILLNRSGFYRHYWRFAGIDELMLIAGLALAAAVANIICLNILYALFPLPNLPRSLPILDALLSFVGIGLVRFSIRFVDATHRRSQMDLSGERLLIVGAGVAGVALAEDMLRHPRLGYQPIAFIDDDPFKKGLKVRGIPVVGDRSTIAKYARQLDIHQVIIAIPSASGPVIRQLVDICQKAGIRARTLPGLSEILSGQIKAGAVRPLKIEDLLRREPIETDINDVRELLQRKHILVTGAGGSIGSELCRQILKCNPAEIVLMGHGENSIFLIHQELQQALRAFEFDPLPVLHPVIADMRNQGRLEHVFEKYKPDIVFHGAAHKHVPMMEHNPTEAVTNNVQGTRNLLNCALQYNVQHFVMISSDKAVKPTSVMGASKRIAEFLVLHTARQSGRCFSIVRFGNVLGSRGSVIPTFKSQIDAGGPVTITHPSITRYFMTIPEAVQLVLQSSVLSKGGEVFMLNMGKPIKIIDLAEDLIRLSGYEPGRDIEIVYTGLRPGEKLHEELLIPGEEYKPTSHEKILAVKNAEQIVPDDLDVMVDILCKAATKSKENLIQLLIKKLVANYTPNHIEPAAKKSSPAIKFEWVESPRMNLS